MQLSTRRAGAQRTAWIMYYDVDKINENFTG
jgi:hypothetical protein